MNAGPTHWRRLAVKLAQHAARTLPGARSPWGDAMRRELDYIGDDAAAFRWALGCILTSYRARLTHRPCFNARTAWRQVATMGILMVLIGLALQEHAGGKTEPPRPAFDEAPCDRPNASARIHQRRSDPGVGRPIRSGGEASIDPAHCGADGQSCALGRISPGRPQGEAIQSVRGKDYGGLHRPSGAGTGPVGCRSDDTDPLPPRIPDTPKAR
jgi:hypothetical protein